MLSRSCIFKGSQDLAWSESLKGQTVTAGVKELLLGEEEES